MNASYTTDTYILEQTILQCRRYGETIKSFGLVEMECGSPVVGPARIGKKMLVLLEDVVKLRDVFYPKTNDRDTAFYFEVIYQEDGAVKEISYYVCPLNQMLREEVEVLKRDVVQTNYSTRRRTRTLS